MKHEENELLDSQNQSRNSELLGGDVGVGTHFEEIDDASAGEDEFELLKQQCHSAKSLIQTSDANTISPQWVMHPIAMRRCKVCRQSFDARFRSDEDTCWHCLHPESQRFVKQRSSPDERMSRCGKADKPVDVQELLLLMGGLVK